MHWLAPTGYFVLKPALTAPIEWGFQLDVKKWDLSTCERNNRKGLGRTPFYEGSIAAIYHLFRILQKSHDLIFIYSAGIRDFYQ
jgi:hypothetical protein